MQVDIELKQTIRAIDLALSAGRKRQSAKTGFVHGFATDDFALDTIPVYENFCFAFALFRQKTAESIQEGKQILERLFAFQTEAGDFPTYLHEFPKCFDFHLSLKIAPILIHILNDFGFVLKEEFKSQIKKCLEKAIKPPQSPLWEHRYLACRGIRSVIDFKSLQSARDWFEAIVSLELLGERDFPIPYHEKLQVFLGDHFVQEKDNLQPIALEYVLAEKEGFSSRLLQDHLHQLHSAVLLPFTSTQKGMSDIALKENPPSIFWNSNEHLNSLCFPFGKWEGENRIIFEIVKPFEMGRNDIFEASIYCNASSDLRFQVNGEKGTVFYVGDVISILSSEAKFDLSFEILEGNGDFCGHLFLSNRPGQISCKGSDSYKAFDQCIGLRTLRRDDALKIGVNVTWKS